MSSYCLLLNLVIFFRLQDVHVVRTLLMHYVALKTLSVLFVLVAKHLQIN